MGLAYTLGFVRRDSWIFLFWFLTLLFGVLGEDLPDRFIHAAIIFCARDEPNTILPSLGMSGKMFCCDEVKLPPLVKLNGLR